MADNPPRTIAEVEDFRTLAWVADVKALAEPDGPDEQPESEEREEDRCL